MAVLGAPTHSSRIPEGISTPKRRKTQDCPGEWDLGSSKRSQKESKEIFPINSTFLAVLNLFSTRIHAKILGFMGNTAWERQSPGVKFN